MRGVRGGGGVRMYRSKTAGERACGSLPVTLSLAWAQSAWSESAPSPASVTIRPSFLTPRILTLTSLGVSPALIIPLRQRTLPLPNTMNSTEPGRVCRFRVRIRARRCGWDCLRRTCCARPCPVRIAPCRHQARRAIRIVRPLRHLPQDRSRPQTPPPRSFVPDSRFWES